MTGPSLTHRNQGDNLLYFVVGDIVRAHYEGDVEITAFSATEEPGRINAQAPWLHIVNPRKNPLRAIAVLFGANVYFIAGAIPFHDNFRLMLQQFFYALVGEDARRKIHRQRRERPAYQQAELQAPVPVDGAAGG